MCLIVSRHVWFHNRDRQHKPPVLQKTGTGYVNTTMVCTHVHVTNCLLQSRQVWFHNRDRQHKPHVLQKTGTGNVNTTIISTHVHVTNYVHVVKTLMHSQMFKDYLL